MEYGLKLFEGFQIVGWGLQQRIQISTGAGVLVTKTYGQKTGKRAEIKENDMAIKWNSGTNIEVIVPADKKLKQVLNDDVNDLLGFKVPDGQQGRVNVMIQYVLEDV